MRRELHEIKQDLVKKEQKIESEKDKMIEELINKCDELMSEKAEREQKEKEEREKGEQEGEEKEPKEEDKKGLWKRSKITKKPKRYKEPILMEIKKNGEMDIIENVKPGNYRMRTPEGKQVIVHLDPKKMQMIPDGMGDDYRGFVHYEEELGCYPSDVVSDLTNATNIITNLQAQYRDLDLMGKLGTIININTLKWIIMGAIGLLMASILIYFYMPQINIWMGVTQPAVQTITQNVTGG